MQRHTYKQDKNVCYVDGVEVGSFTYSSWSIDYSLFLFGRSNASGVLNDASPCRIYSCKMWNDGELIRSYVPCYNKELEQYGLYDTVTEEFYGNAGSGKFLGKTFVEEGETCKVFDYEQYFVDHEMMGDISTTTITGTGAENDPYIINSSEDFWWASKYMDCNNKNIMLGCDIVLNEENFDDDGNVIDGTSADGRVYNWKLWCFNSNTMNFDGKNHLIEGLYRVINDNYGSLFEKVNILKNLRGKDFYLDFTYYVGGFVTTANLIDNCHMLNGFMFARQGQCGGIAYSSFIVRNCTNRMTIHTLGMEAMGIVYGVQGYRTADRVENCINYGNIYGKGNYLSGIGNAKYIVDCVNYGNITSDDNYIGGIRASISNIATIVNCKNYGKIKGQARVGGISGWVRAGTNYVQIIDCESYGEVEGGFYCGQIVGLLAVKLNTTIGSNLIIKGCKTTKSTNWKNNNAAIIGSVDKNCHYVIQDCEAEIENYDSFSLFGDLNSNANGKCSNIKFTIKGNGNKLRLYSSPNGTLSLDNILIETDFNVSNYSLFNSLNKCSLVKFDGIIIKTPAQKYYYGSNFSGFNISWKTGAINLNSMSSVGSFAPRLTEENLIGMGFEKKTI